jgi:hypothetical protein
VRRKIERHRQSAYQDLELLLSECPRAQEACCLVASSSLPGYITRFVRASVSSREPLTKHQVEKLSWAAGPARQRIGDDAHDDDAHIVLCSRFDMTVKLL